MKKEYSLTKSTDFDKIISAKKIVRVKGITLFYRKSDQFKIGIAVPKKLGNAVFRNKNKRIIKNIIATLKPYDVKYDTILIVNSEFVNMTYELKTKMIKESFEKLINV